MPFLKPWPVTKRSKWCEWFLCNGDFSHCENPPLWMISRPDGQSLQMCDDCLYSVLECEGNNVVRHLDDIFGEEEPFEILSSPYTPIVTTVPAVEGVTYERPKFTIEND